MRISSLGIYKRGSLASFTEARIRDERNASADGWIVLWLILKLRVQWYILVFWLSSFRVPGGHGRFYQYLNWVVAFLCPLVFSLVCKKVLNSNVVFLLEGGSRLPWFDELPLRRRHDPRVCGFKRCRCLCCFVFVSPKGIVSPLLFSYLASPVLLGFVFHPWSICCQECFVNHR
jgi:hypothetical protein